MTTLVQISDAHFGTERPQVLAALITLIKQLAPRVIVFSGDITQRARRAQFDAAGRFIKDLDGIRIIAIPGNHDIPLFNIVARLFFPYAGYRRTFGEDLEPQVDVDGFSITCVNTTRPSRHKDGEVSAQQVDRVARRLEAAPSSQLRIVVTHQPVHVTRDQDIENLLHGREVAVPRWVSAGVDIVMGGHIHLPYVRPLAEAYPGLSRRAWAVQAGTAVSHRIRDGINNSINVIRHDASSASAKVERWDFDVAVLAFRQVQVEELHLDRS